MKKNIFLCCIIFATCSNHVNEKSIKEPLAIDNNIPKEESFDQEIAFQDFYTSFRKAIMENDSIAIIDCAQFKLKIKGYEDNDPTLYIDKPLFWRAFNEVMSLSYDYDEEKDSSISLKDLITKENNVTNLPYYSKYGQNESSFGNMNFSKINGQWKLTSMYLNSRDFKKKM